jgi:cysteine-rich repeat protein
MKRVGPWSLLLATVVSLLDGVPAAGIDFGGLWIVERNTTSPVPVVRADRWSVAQIGTQLAVAINGGSPDGGFIDPATGVFEVDLGPTPGGPGLPPCPNATASGTVAADGQTFTGELQSYFFKITPPAGCFGVFSLLSGTRSRCGDGVVDAGEQCDDGNAADGDCCSRFCGFEAPGSSCGGECGSESCDGTGACVPLPATICGTTCHPGTCSGGGCVLGAPAAVDTPCESDFSRCTADTCNGTGLCGGTSMPVVCATCATCDVVGGCLDAPRPACDAMAPKTVGLKTGDPARRSATWGVGDPQPTGFGDPTTTSSYALCVFDVSAPLPTALLRAAAPAGGTCGGKPCWKATATGFSYRDPERTPDGLATLTLRSSPRRGTKVKAKGKGPALALPPSFAGVTDLVVQLQGPACVGASYHDVAVSDDGTKLHARE